MTVYMYSITLSLLASHLVTTFCWLCTNCYIRRIITINILELLHSKHLSPLT